MLSQRCHALTPWILQRCRGEDAITDTVVQRPLMCVVYQHLKCDAVAGRTPLYSTIAIVHVALAFQTNLLPYSLLQYYRGPCYSVAGMPPRLPVPFAEHSPAGKSHLWSYYVYIGLLFMSAPKTGGDTLPLPAPCLCVSIIADGL